MGKIETLLANQSDALQAAELNGCFNRAFITSIAETGFFDLTTPKAFGGNEVEYEDVLSIVSSVAIRSGSLAWCLMLMAQHNISIRTQDPSLVSELFAEKPLLLGSSFMPPGRALKIGDEYVLSGTWRYVSGAHFINWIMVDAEIESREGGGVAKFFVPASNLTIEGDWNTVGMRATGSCSVSLENVRVPSRRCVFQRQHADGEKRGRIPRKYRIPQRVMIALGTIAPMVGMLQGMGRMALDRTGPRRQKSSLEDISRREHLLRIMTSIHQVPQLFAMLCEKVTAMTMRARPFDLQDQHWIVMQSSDISVKCRELSSALFAVSGTQAASVHDPLSRYMIDIHTMSTHYLVQPAVTNVNAALFSLNG